MLSGADIVVIGSLLCTVIGALAAVLCIDKYPKIRRFLLLVICTSAGALIWVVARGSLLGDPALSIRELDAIQGNARKVVADEYRRDSEMKQQEAERKAYLAALRTEEEKRALEEGRTAILGTWNCPGGGVMTFNTDSTVSNNLYSHMYTYKFLDSKHIVVTGFYGLGFSSNYDVSLSGTDQYVAWHNVICRRPTQ